jgi:diguanylate cyclase (GGDEF)-like protein
MKDDVHYAEFLFLSNWAKRSFDYFNPLDAKQREATGLDQMHYIEMIVGLIEDLCVAFDRIDLQALVGRLRGEYFVTSKPSQSMTDYQWNDPRATLTSVFAGNPLQRLRVTYRGLRRIEELRDLLKRDRILEPLGELLDIRYFIKDCADALQRDTSIPVSVLRLDMDGFKAVNEGHGHAAGDVVMKSYLHVVKDCIGTLGTGYRGRGDEVVALVIGQGHDRAGAIGESIRQGVEALQCEHAGVRLPKVTVSVGVATTPPDKRTEDIELVADERQKRAKQEGKNRVVSK